MVYDGNHQSHPLSDVGSPSGNEFLISRNPVSRLLAGAVTGLPERVLISNDPVLISTYSQRALKLGSVALLGLVGFGCLKDRRTHVWGLFLAIPFMVIFVLDLLQGTEAIMWSRYCSFVSVGIIAAPIAAAFAIHKRLGWLLAGCLILLMVPFAGLERVLGSMRYDHMSSKFAPIVLKNPAKLPLASFSGSAASGSLASAWDPSIIEWARLPGFLPRPTVSLDQSPSLEVIEKLRASSPNGRFWLTTYGLPAKQTENQPPPWMNQLIPGIKLLQGPWLIQRGRGIRSERPPVTLWLMEFGDPNPS